MEGNELRRMLDKHAELALEAVDSNVRVTEGSSSNTTTRGGILVIQTQEGAPGTRLLASWSQGLRAKHPELCLITHFIGAAATSNFPDLTPADVIPARRSQENTAKSIAAKSMLRRVVAELRSYYVGQVNFDHWLAYLLNAL